ncbi:MAG TPA: hypothetical protein VE079_15775 [Ensifer sp.]|nr:hypothetical protein [Ensifer sp.]
MKFTIRPYETISTSISGKYAAKAEIGNCTYQFEGATSWREAIVGLVSLMFRSRLWTKDHIIAFCTYLDPNPEALAEEALEDHCRWSGKYRRERDWWDA